MATTVDRDALNLTRAIALTESGQGGKPNYTVSGKSGERGAYQWMPGNFEAAAKAAGLNPSDFSPENQDKVAYYQVKKYKDQGYQPWEIASLWNSGSPDKWKDHKGVNKYGVAYDTPAHVAKVKENYLALSGESGASPKQPVEQKEPGVAENLGKNLAKRAHDIADVFQQPETTPLPAKIGRGLLRTGGAVAGGIGDIVGAGISAAVPDFIEKPVMGAIGGAVKGALESEPGRAATEAYGRLSPEIQKDIGAVGNIASLVPIGRGGQVAAQAAKEVVPTAVRAAATTPGLIGRTAQKSLVNEALEIVSPRPTPKSTSQALKAGRGEVGGLLGEVSVAPNPQTIRAAEAAAGIVKKGRTAVENANAVRNEIAKTAQKLEGDIKALEIVPIVQKGEIDNLFKKAVKEIGENPTMVGDAAKSAQLILNKFKSFLPKGDITALDLLNARKKLDSWMQSQSVSDVFNPNYQTAKTVALRHIRQGANELVAQKAPNIAVKDLLGKQSALYDALDGIVSKAVREVGTTGLDRWVKKHPGIVGLIKLTGVSIGAGTGIGATQGLFAK